MSLFHMRTARPISTKFCTELQTDLGQVLNTSMTQTLWPRGTPNSKTLSDNQRKNFALQNMH